MVQNFNKKTIWTIFRRKNWRAQGEGRGVGGGGVYRESRAHWKQPRYRKWLGYVHSIVRDTCREGGGWEARPLSIGRNSVGYWVSKSAIISRNHFGNSGNISRIDLFWKRVQTFSQKEETFPETIAQFLNHLRKYLIIIRAYWRADHITKLVTVA